MNNQSFSDSCFSYCRDDDSEKLSEFIEKGEDICSLKDSNGYFLLHEAAANGSNKCLKFLLNLKKSGAKIDVNMRNDEMETPLHLAVDYGSEECVKLFLEEEDIDVNAQDDYGQTPLHFSIHSFECMKLLLEREDIDVNSKDLNLQTALHLAVSDFSQKSTELLLTREDIDVNSQDVNGETILHRAAAVNFIEILPILIKIKDIDINITNKHGDAFLNFIQKEEVKQKVKNWITERDSH